MYSHWAFRGSSFSIHALLAESDSKDPISSTSDIYFSIHALLAESDVSLMLYDTSSLIFLSTLSLRRATHYDNYNLHCVEFSIHALLAESDPVVTSTAGVATNFLSTLSLRRATPKSVIYLLDEYFLSTLSLRRATRALLSGSGSLRLFYPRSPCGERPRGRAVLWVPSPFLSTLSLRRAT